MDSEQNVFCPITNSICADGQPTGRGYAAYCVMWDEGCKLLNVVRQLENIGHVLSMAYDDTYDGIRTVDIL